VAYRTQWLPWAMQEWILNLSMPLSQAVAAHQDFVKLMAIATIHEEFN